MAKLSLKIMIYGLKAGCLTIREFFQDGVGVGVRSPKQAKHILDQLEDKLGKDKVIIVLEAFRVKRMGNLEPHILGKLFLS